MGSAETFAQPVSHADPAGSPLADAPAAPTPPSPGLDARVRNEQARLMLDRTRLSTAAGVPAAVLIVWLLWPHQSHALLLSWLAAKVTVASLRALIDHHARRDGEARATHWGRRFEGALFTDGVLFGMLGWLLRPQDLPNIDGVLVATLLGIAAIGTVVLSGNWRPCLAFVLPLLLPSTLLHLLAEDRISVYLGLGMSLYLLLLVLEVRKSSAHTAQMLRLRFQTDQLAAEREAALEQAIRSDAAKSQFLATMSHEMRTPLHGILGLTRELQRPPGPQGEAPVQQHLQTLERTGDHLLGIINDVLDYSKIESGHLRLTTQDFELDALLRSVHALTLVAAEERGLALRLESDVPAPCWLSGDAVRLRQVVLNLIGNAVKFTETGEVVLRAGVAAGDAPGRLVITLEVSDTGPGIPLAERERIFDAFHQTDGSYARRKGGTGLGLTISRELARAMGGELSCVEPSGPGASFRLVVPFEAGSAPAPAAVAGTAAPAPKETSPGTAGLRVLLAEDNEVNAIVARAMLERAGMHVIHARNGEEAVALARRREHDLVLMDCQMPDIDGFEATARIRADERAAGWPGCTIIALTANALEGDRERCIAAGMDEHLSKPFREEQLLALLQRQPSTSGVSA